MDADVFSADDGAHSIATIDTSVAGGASIIAPFGQWGAIQLVLAVSTERMTEGTLTACRNRAATQGGEYR
jgi:hypothetical protein